MVKYILILFLFIISTSQIVMSPARFARTAGGTPAVVRNQVLIGGISDDLSSAATEYNTILGGSVWNSTATRIRNVFPCAGKLKNLRIWLSAAPTSTNSWTFTIMRNDTARALAVTISGTDVTGYNSTDSVTVLPGQYVQIRSTYSGTPATAQARWSCEFNPTNTNYTVIGMGTETNQADASTQYMQAMGSHVTWETAGENAYQIIPAAGTLTRMYVLTSAAPGVNGLTLSLYRNGSAEALSVALTTGTSGLDTTHSVSVSAGDRVCIRSVSGTITNSRIAVSMVFTPTTQGQVACLGGSDDVMANTENIYPIAAGSTWSSSTNARIQLTSQAITLKNFYVNLSANPGAGSTLTLTIRDDGVATPLSVQITDAGSTGSDADTVNIAAGSLIDINATITGTLGTVYARWGFVQNDNN